MSTYEQLKQPTEKNISKNIKNKKIIKKIKEADKDNNKIIVGKYSDAPDYLKDNEYIKNGYLINCNSFKLVLRSLFVCSNETINVWSHLLGCIFSIFLIIYTAKYIKTGTKKELSQIEFENMKLKVNEAVIPWMAELNSKNSNKNNINISSMINKMMSNSQNFVVNSGTKSTFITNIVNFLEKNDNLINQISLISKSKNSHNIQFLTRKWEICSNKITDCINEYALNDIKGENISRWPLFVMLSAAIICFGFSTSFHWFSVYGKELYSLLCRLDYAGITFLIPGSCYPPYYYFYYCERCKKIYSFYIILL